MRIGTRKSPLAMVQTQEVGNLLEQKFPHITQSCCVVGIQTTGDKLYGPLSAVGGKGLFTKEIDEQLLAGNIDIAVHSMKDVPSVLPQGLCIPAILLREDPRDMWISEKHPKFSDLPPLSKIGTCSLRRTLQLLHLRPDLEIVPLRGNVGTRISKITEGLIDGTVLARAGINRLHLDNVWGECFSAQTMLPAVAQGAIGIACRTNDIATIEMIAELNHWESSICVDAERAFLREFGGTCNIPIAAYARIQHNKIQLHALWGDMETGKILRESATALSHDIIYQAQQAAQRLLSRIKDL